MNIIKKKKLTIIVFILISSKYIESKRVISRVNKANTFINVFDSNKRKNGAKDFLSHKVWIIETDGANESRSNKTVLTICFPTGTEQLGVSAVEHGLQTIKLTDGYNTTIRLWFLGYFTIEFQKNFFTSFNEFFENIFSNQDIIGSNTRLF